ncbi:hypothetical protein [Acinetobacter phage P577]|uniref:hypothetical protein n=1 Tax=Acinetobacter phage YMC13/03/R2096 TaxID=1560342 RepID=UPI00052A3559|nr:hypothetical protein ACQ36_gp091 [Acinetobacter phage YMC13/03/R2096]AIW02842.1 hypothetical protein BPABA577_01080 [Acinetobacter phage YMC13/03/R2096]WNT46166.1 hypothetical protein [Acinetobacter phage P577]
MSTNTQNIKMGDKVKVISTERQLSEIGASGDNLKGKIGVVTSIFRYGFAVDFDKNGCWCLRFEDVHKVVE